MTRKKKVLDGPMESRPKLEGLRALVVDDDIPSGKLLEIILRTEGGAVRVAQSAEDAFVAISQFDPKVILLDLVLPLMSGLLFAQRLKSDPATSHIVLIAVTAFNGPETERIAKEVGCVAYFRKPVDEVALLGLLVDQMGGAR